MPLDRVRRTLKRSEDQLRDASIFIVGTEGKSTEQAYFEQFQNRRIKVVPVVCEDGHSSPEGVLSRVREVIGAFDFGKGDTFWIVVDKDQWTDKMFAAVRSQCRKANIALLVSNLRFEVFLALHFTDSLSDGDFLAGNYETFLRKKLGAYSKSKYDAATLFGLRGTACDLCEARDDTENEIFPPEHCSRVYLLIRAIDRASIVAT